PCRCRQVSGISPWHAEDSPRAVRQPARSFLVPFGLSAAFGGPQVRQASHPAALSLLRSFMKVAVLGAGLVGYPMTLDLAKEPSFDLTIIDVREETLDRLSALGLRTRRADLMNAGDLLAVAQSADIVVSAVSGFMGYRTLETLVNAGKTVVDI